MKFISHQFLTTQRLRKHITEFQYYDVTCCESQHSRYWYLDAKRKDWIAVLDESDLIESVAAARQTVRQLFIGQVETIDILQYQQTLGIDDNNGREPQTTGLLLWHDPEEAGGKKEDERQPTVIRDTPDLYVHAITLTTARL